MAKERSRRRWVSGPLFDRKAPAMRFSSTVNSRKGRLRSGQCTSPRRRISCAGRPSMRSAPNRTSPARTMSPPAPRFIRASKRTSPEMARSRTAGPSECSLPKRPPLCRRRIDLASSSDSAGFRPPSGSSSSSSSGSVAIARATSSRLRSPCDSAEAGSSAMSEMPTNSSASIAFASMLFTHSPPPPARRATRPPKRLVSRSKRRSGADMRLEYRVDDRKFLEQMDAELAGWANPAERLHQALEKDEFTLFCQPIVALTGAERYPMAEILVRLREEERALLPPGEFLPVFEHYRLMPQLDRWVVRTTVKRLARGSRIPRFTVNLSGQTLEDADFPRFVAGQLASNHVVAGALLFEIDESDTLARLESRPRFANPYRARGGKLMIDGFGRRSVSFNAIEALGAEYVKVDGAITRKLLTSEVAKAKMNALLRVGEALGFAMVADFVEDQAVLLRLKALGVGYAQGFGIYQPHPVDSFAAEPAR